MKKCFCEYCGEPLENRCECARLAAEEHEEFLINYYEDPFVREGARQQDLIDMYRREQ